jgi:hypothetical protein
MTQELPVAVLRLAGLADASEAVHAIGTALQMPFPADLASVCTGLAEIGDALVVLDDADVPELALVVERLSAVAPKARFLAAGRGVALRGPSTALGPLPEDILSRRFPGVDCSCVEGSPGLALLASAAGDDPRDTDRFLRSLPGDLQFVAACEGGVPGDVPLGTPAELLLPERGRRVTLRRSVAEALRRIRPVPDMDLARFLHGRCGHLLALAEGDSLPWGAGTARPADHVLLRLISLHHPEPDEATRALVAWARMWILVGQAARARVWRRQSRETTAGRGIGRTEALLAWVEGDALAEDGELREALVAWEFATTGLRRSRDLGLLARLHMQCGDRLVGRGSHDLAAGHFEEAAGLSEQRSDAAGRAVAGAGLAAVALGRGNPNLAFELLERARRSMGDPAGVSRTSVLLDLLEVQIAIHRGRLDLARTLLQRLDVDLDRTIGLRAQIDRLRADVFLRSGDCAAAGAAARRVLVSCGQLGNRVASGRTTRLLGDVEAVAGRPTAANAHYEKAVREHVRCGDLDGLQTTLDHRIVLETSCGDGDLAAELRGLRHELDVCLHDEAQAD